MERRTLGEREESVRIQRQPRSVSVEYANPPLSSHPPFTSHFASSRASSPLPLSPPVARATQSPENITKSPTHNSEGSPHSPPKWTVLAPEGYKPVRDKGKWREGEGAVEASTNNTSTINRTSTATTSIITAGSEEKASPRGVRKVERSFPTTNSPPLREYEEEAITLKWMTAEEKQLVKGLIKLTKQKNKMLDTLEANLDMEKETVMAHAEFEKEGLLSKLQAVDAELATRTRELANETMRCNEMAEKIQKLEREKQEMRLALAAAKRESRLCKQKCDAELNMQTQSLLDLTAQLSVLSCSRQSLNCIICEEKVGMVVLEPCHHMVLCGACSNKVNKCPMCRVDIRNKYEVYNNWIL